MSEENVKIVLSAEDRASAALDKFISQINRLKKSLDGLKFNPIQGPAVADLGAKVRNDFAKGQADAMRGLRQRFTFEGRMSRQRIAEERALGAEQARQARARRVADDASLRRFREQWTFQNRMIRQQAGMERDAERARASAARETIRLDRYRFGLRERYERDQARDRARADRESARETRASERRHADVRRSVSRGFSDGRDVAGRVTDAARSVSILGAVGAGALTKLGSIGLEARSRIDTAEANLRMFGGQSRDQVNATRSGWLNRSAVEFGFRPHDALNAFTEVLKAGIPEIAAKDVTRTIMGASAGLDLDVGGTTKLVGRLSTLTQNPNAFDSGAIERMLNGIAVVAKVTAADSKEIVSSLRRGAGVLGSTKMSVQDLTAFTGVGISAGMQEGKAGTFMDFLANDLVNAKHARGQRGKDLSEGFRLLGLGSNASVSRQVAQDPTALLLKLFERMARMSPEKAGRAASLIGMREWRGEMLMMARASPMLRRTVEAERDPRNAGHLQQAQNERLGTLAGLRSQLTATFDLAWEAVGGGIEDIVREISTFFIDLGKFTDFDVIEAHVHTLIDGFVDGLGFKNVKEMLEAAFGKPGSFNFSTLKPFFEFAQGFGRGVREVIDTVKAVVASFTGANMDADALGNLSAKVIGFSLALTAITPYVAVLGGVATALGGFAVTIGTIATSLRAAGLMGGTGATAGGFLGAGAMATAGGLLGAAFLATVANKLGILKAPDTSKGWGRGIVEFLDPGLASRLFGDGKGEAKPAPPAWQDPPARVQRQSATDDFRGKIEPAAFTSTADVSGAVDRMGLSVREMSAHLQKIALTSGGADLKALASDTTQSMGGGTSTGGGQSAGFYKPDMQVPDWYGRSRGGGSAGAPTENFTGTNANVLKQAAASLGTSPKDLATVISYETAGKFSPSIRGGKGGNYQGLIQFGPAERAKYGVTGNETFSEQMPKVVRFLKDHGFRPGMGLNQLYATINGGNPYVSQGASDGNGTIASHVAKMQRTHGARADAFLNSGDGGGSDPVASLKGDATRAGQAVDIAGKFLGQNEHRDHASLSKFVGHDVAGNLNAWCARFVNASLRDAGVKGTGSAMANSFLKWGQAVDAEAVKKGDVAVEHRGKGANAGGGHVGLATGRTQRNKRTGELEIETVSGNHGDAVVKDWTAASKLAIRRSTDAAATAAVASMKETAATARRAQDGGAERLQAPRDGRVDLGGGLQGVPFGAKPSIDDVVANVPAGAGRGGGGAGSSRAPVTIHNTMNIQGGANSPSEIANLAQRKIAEDWNHRAHDLEPEMA